MTSYANIERVGNTFKTASSINKNEAQQTKYTWQDKKGNVYPIYISRNGAVYIIKKSAKTNKEYKQYLAKEIKEQINKELNIKKK